MSSIRVLSPDVIIGIAAGEVIDKPAAVIKELVENALDAGANRISITLDQAGLKRISITDNGKGMTAEELKLSLVLHATSKLSSLDDLFSLRTYGFRGEALASIASAATITITSKPTTEAVAYKISSSHSETTDPIPVAHTQGTTITVIELFKYQPARKKSLRSAAQQLAAVIDCVTAAAIANPTVSFFLTNDGKTLLNLPAHSNRQERVLNTLGFHLDQWLFPFSFEHKNVIVSGSLGHPQIARKSQPHRYWFVNNRPVEIPQLNTVVKAAYGPLLEPKLDPLFAIFLDLDPASIDPNAHPQKTTIRLLEEPEVIAAVAKALSETLAAQTVWYQEPALKPDKKASQLTLNQAKQSNVKPWQPTPPPTSQEVWQLHDTYLFVEHSTGFYLLDQHAAHERILFAEFLETYQRSVDEQRTQRDITQLSPAVVLELTPGILSTLQIHQETLESLGFEFDVLGAHSLKVTTVPTWLADRPLLPILTELCDDIQAGKPLTGLDSTAEKTLAYLACRSAIKAGDKLTQEQRHELIEKLLQTPHYQTCPHGRPTLITVSKSELERWFRRRK